MNSTDPNLDAIQAQLELFNPRDRAQTGLHRRLIEHTAAWPELQRDAARKLIVTDWTLRIGAKTTRRPKVDSLDQWLHIATKNLAKTPKERISAEMRDHYHQALHDGLALGMSDLWAHWDALISLGKPRSASRAFQRAYPMTGEEAFFQTILYPRQGIQPRFNWMFQGLLFLSAMLQVVFDAWRGATSVAHLSILVLLSLLIFFIYHGLVPAIGRTKDLRRAVLWHMTIYPLCIMVAIGIALFSPSSVFSQMPEFNLPLAFLAAMAGMVQFVIHRRLLRMLPILAQAELPLPPVS